jgi:superfamily II DNA or RNA helicase
MFIGSKGYTIPKELLTPLQQTELKRNLTFKQGSKDYGDVKEFFAYRESPNKLYVPRFYGSKYGPAPLHISEGSPIHLSFNGTIRKDQQDAIDAFMKVKCGLLELPCGFGKTILALYLIHLIKRKTIVIVHKEFLLEQWIERIHEFLPGATIGRIQGDTIDINKDIVIGMLQSISMRSYPKEVFQDFGFTIIDETHHIAAEVFSNALFHLVTPYMLGLSATMERKDGLTKVFKLFLGEIAYSAQRERTTVFIHKVAYSTDNKEFNEVIRNFRGDTNYTCMIKKISEFNPRKDCILNLLTILLPLSTTNQVMILAHTKALLNYLYDAIEHRNLASVGYYIGGMKQTALKESETKKIILATYAMAEEALDIKSLSTLILATPKTDVTQAVGRILRIKHAMPLVIDIVDSHPTFENQWKKRRAYYNSQSYTIVETTHKTYPAPIIKQSKKTSCLIKLTE